MLGYYGNDVASQQVLRDGWLHTGDLGWMDEAGNLHLVGRKKEMILGASGENVYPDELEQVYGDSPFVRELSVVGLPSGADTENRCSVGSSRLRTRENCPGRLSGNECGNTCEQFPPDCHCISV